MLRGPGTGGKRDGGRDRLPKLSTPPLALLSCRQRGKGQRQRDEREDETSATTFLPLMPPSTWEMVIRIIFCFLPIAMYTLGHFA